MGKNFFRNIFKGMKKRECGKIVLCKYLNANCVYGKILKDGTYGCVYKRGPMNCKLAKEISLEHLERLEER